MTIPLRIAATNLIDAGTVAASSEVSTLTAVKLQTLDIRDVWQASSTTAYVLADLLSSKTIGITALINCSLDADDTIRVQSSTADATGAAGDAYDSGVIAAAVDPVFAMFVHPIEPAVSGRYLRIDVVQSSTPRVGRWFAGATWAPSHHFRYGWEPLWRDFSRRSYSLGAMLYFDRKPRQRGFRFTLKAITESEAESQVHEINRVNGASRDILVCRDITATNLGKVTLWGPMEDMITYPQIMANAFTAEFNVWNRL